MMFKYSVPLGQPSIGVDSAALPPQASSSLSIASCIFGVRRAILGVSSRETWRPAFPAGVEELAVFCFSAAICPDNERW